MYIYNVRAPIKILNTLFESGDMRGGKLKIFLISAY